MNNIFHTFVKMLDQFPKRQSEFNYWQKVKNTQKILANDHYKFFFTNYFCLTKKFYFNKKILDIGCGPCGSLEWADNVKERIGLDPLVNSYRKLGINNHKMLYVDAGVEHMPFKNNYFDIISSFNSLDHVDNLDLALSEIVRVLKKSGTFLLITDVNHIATMREPIEFSWDIKEKIISKGMKLIKSNCYERNEGVYQSIIANISYNYNNKSKRYGVFTAMFTKI